VTAARGRLPTVGDGDAGDRLPPPAGQLLDRAGTFQFEFDGRHCHAIPGDTVGSALYAAGCRVFSRSFKYHRPRGLLCVDGRCPNCLCNVDSTPNVRVCTLPVQPGMRVRSQNAWPSLARDALGIVDKLSPLLPVGFYYKTFMRPRRLWPVYEKALRNAAGLGRLDPRREPPGDYVHEYRHTDLAVVGGGPAGLAAALEAARLGAHVTLIDDQSELGGHLRYQLRAEASQAGASSTPGYERARTMAAEVAATPNVDTLLAASAFGVYEGDLLGIAQGPRLIELRYRALVVATGQQQRPLVFANNDLPGIMLASGVQRLMHLYGVRPGRRAVVASNGPQGLGVAEDLLGAGLAVAAVADARSARDLEAGASEAVQRLRAAGVPVLAGLSPSAALGDGRVQSVVLSHLDGVGRPVAGAYQQLPCDLLVLATGADGLVGLLAQAGYPLVYDPARDRFSPASDGLPEGVCAAGEVAGASTLEEMLMHGRAAGARSAAALGLASAVAQPEVRAAQPPSRVRPLVSVAAGRAGKAFVCLCEDVTEQEIVRAMAEGFDHVETLKRYTTFSMGPCQGKMCHANAVALAARENGVGDRSGTALTTARPPAQPIELGTLAGVLHEPVRLSAMHDAHLRLGAQMMDLGEWKRARRYVGSANDEVLAVRERVGIIDVSSLGKLDVRGKDAGKLLDFIYANRVSDLKQGRVRYGVICDDSGIVLDDGTLARVAEDRFFVSTTTGGIGMVQEWMDWWVAARRDPLCVHVTNVTSALSAVNLAGPRSRDVLQKLTPLDVSGAGAPYLSALPADVAGVPALILRIGFVGELGYEMHVAAEYGEHVWQALMAAGREFGIQPFGVEAQRIMRLEKGHLIVSQDTDALSNPYEAGLAWLVKLDKPDFVGKPSLERLKTAGMRDRLVGFRVDDATLVPNEGDAVERGGQPVGRVTSARFSPTLRASIGLAWVPTEQAAVGTPLRIRVNGHSTSAQVVKTPFYDPDGARMKA